MNIQDKIYVAGHLGMVGSALVRKLQKEGYCNILLQTRQETDLVSQAAVMEFFAREKPDYVFLAAAKVGGILANNTYRGEFLYQNLMIELNIIEAARLFRVKKLLFFGSSCIYPRDCSQPIREEYLLTDSLEPTNEPYAIAKIAGLKLCENYRRQYDCRFISVMPTNLYGPGDNYNLSHSHVVAALIRKFHEAKIKGAPQVIVWGSGSPLREFLYVDDLAEACFFLMQKYDEESILNVGTGKDISIKELAKLIQAVVSYEGEILFDPSKPDGTPRKLLDISRITAKGWYPRYGIQEGLTLTYKAFQKELSSGVLAER